MKREYELVNKWGVEMKVLHDRFNQCYNDYLEHDEKDYYLDMLLTYKDRIINFYEHIEDMLYYTNIEMKGLYRYSKATVKHVYDVMDELYN